MFINDKPFEIGPEMAVFRPANMIHKFETGPDQDLTYVVLYAPPGPEQLLKEWGERAFAPQ